MSFITMAMAAGGSSTSIFLPVPTLPSQNLPYLSQRQVSFTYSKWSSFYPFICSSSTSSTPLIEEEKEEEEEVKENGVDDDVLTASITQESTSFLPPGTCKACGRVEIERGCNGEGRIQGGIATVPGFGWWPIKAYRPCPAFVTSGGRYRRSGQSMDEVVSGSGGGGRDTSPGTNPKVQSSKKKGASKSKS